MDPRYSNYPRANIGPSGSSVGQRPPGAHFDFISESFTIIRNDLGTWVATSLVMLLIGCAVGLPLGLLQNVALYGSPLGSPNASWSQMFAPAAIGLGLLVNSFVYALSFMLTIGIGLMGLKASRGERPQVPELFAPFRLFVPVFLTCLVVTVMIYLGVILLIIPGIIVVGLFSLAPFAAYDQRLSTGDALRWSLENCRPHLWGIFGLFFVAAVISGLGICACYVGYLFTAPILGIVMGLTYGTFVAPAPASFMPYPPAGPIPPYEPPSGPAV